MMTNTQLKNVPELRFKADDGSNFLDWEEKRLSVIADITGGGTPDTSKAEYWNGDINWFTPTEIKKKYLLGSKRRISKNGLKRSSAKILPVGTLLLTTRATIGDISITLIKCSTNQGFQSLIIKEGNFNEFWYYWILNNKKALVRRSSGSTFLEISKSEICKIIASKPTLPEQEKIASFLSSVDTKIDQLNQKKDLLEKYKKGMMQKLFSQEMRFKANDGTDFPDWEEKRLGDIANITGGGTPETNKLEYWNGGINWFTPTEIKRKYLLGSKRTISETGLKRSSAKMLPIGTLLLSTRATIGDISIALQECSTNQGFQSLIVKKDNFNEFWYYWILNNKKTLLRRSSGSTFLEISKTEISKVSVLKPKKEEQQKIADFLSAIDTKISQTNTQVEQANNFKKGLLQQMFV